MCDKLYKTELIDYTGCHPVIAEHLKRGESIWCISPDGREYKVTGYDTTGTYPYQCYTVSGVYTSAARLKPIEQKRKYLKDPILLMGELVCHGWTYSTELMKWTKWMQSGTHSFYRWDLCGTKVRENMFNDLPDYFFVYK